MQPPLEELAFRDPARAADNLSRLAGAVPPGVFQRLRVLLGSAADPDRALHWLDALEQRNRAAFQRLTRSKALLQLLIQVFSYSRFLSEEILQHPEWLEELPGSGDLHRILTSEQFRERLDQFLGHEEGPPPAVLLAQFRRRMILRILLRDVLGYCTLPEVTEELSNLADAILDVTHRRIRNELVKRHGEPRVVLADGSIQEAGFSILALGKLGGRELNYSSDIDLMFVHGGAGETPGPDKISNKEFFKKLANQCTELLSTYTPRGLCYRVDLRLRPDGRLGEISISLDGAKKYYQDRARDWELQMLIKARVAAGDSEPGRQLLAFVEPLIYSTTLDFSAVESVSATRVRIHEKVAARRPASGSDIKLARGGIRDIEFLVQCLQRLHGGREPWVRHGGTLLALFRLRDKDLLSPAEYSRLAEAYQFLRNLEHRLQFDEDRQTHVLPSGREELDLLARKMPAAQLGSGASADSLLRELNTHLEEVQEIYERVIHAQRPIYYTASAPAGGGETVVEVEMAYSEPTASNLVRFLDSRAPGLAASLARSNLRRGVKHFEHFLERILTNPEYLGWLDKDATLAGYVFDLFEHSPYFAEQLIRTPELIEELWQLRDAAPQSVSEPPDNAPDLRRYFRREMLRIQSQSICLREPIFSTLGKTSDLADAAVQAAYRMAVRETAASRPPVTAGYVPRDQMMVIALGRLGQREFDLASDADLVFVLPEAEAPESVFWTRVAERLIDIVTAYTGEGVIFAVDTRLRPNGREGALVQTKSAFKDYFSKKAEAWEGIAYMKSRAVAGDLERATRFLDELQQIDWRRYGQSHRSRKALRQMRQRLEREQGPSNPLKAGHGGYYDIDFALMYLRLKSAGFFFKVLNTPERIDIIEKMGHLERADAVFLNDAATFYRAVDHGLRVFSGLAEGSLPSSPAQLQLLTNLVTRWTPDHLHDQPLNVELAQIQARTREYFERLFGTVE